MLFDSTEAGHHLLHAALPVALAYERQLSAPFDDLERSRLVELLGRMAECCHDLDELDAPRSGH